MQNKRSKSVLMMDRKSKNMKKLMKMQTVDNNQQNITDRSKTCSLIFALSLLGLYFAYEIIQMKNYARNKYTTIFDKKDYDQLGRIKYFQEMNLMPLVEFKISNSSNIKSFDIFKTKQNQQFMDNFDTDQDIDYEKISRYFQVQFVVKKRGSKNSNFKLVRDFVNCKKSMFERYGYTDESLKNFGGFKQMNYYLCPDIENIIDHFYIENGYNSDVRTNFAVEIVKCSKSNCHSDDKVQELLEKFTLNIYFTQDQVNLKQTIGSKPTFQSIEFFQQFKLKYDIYRDNNNFIRQNIVKTYDDLFFGSLIKPSIYKYYDIKQLQLFYTHSKMVYNTNITHNMKDFYIQKGRHTFFGSYFFLTNEYFESERRVFDLLNVLTNFGSILSIFFAAYRLVYNNLFYQIDLGNIMLQTYRKQYLDFDQKDTSIVQLLNDKFKGNCLKYMKKKENETFKFQLEKQESESFNESNQKSIQLDHQEQKSDNISGSFDIQQSPKSSQSQSKKQTNKYQASFSNNSLEIQVNDVSAKDLKRKCSNINGSSNARNSLSNYQLQSLTMKKYNSISKNQNAIKQQHYNRNEVATNLRSGIISILIIVVYKDLKIFPLFSKKEVQNNLFGSVKSVYEQYEIMRHSCFDEENLRFTTLDQLGASMLFKPFACIFKKTRLIHNQDVFLFMKKRIEKMQSIKSQIQNHQVLMQLQQSNILIFQMLEDIVNQVQEVVQTLRNEKSRSGSEQSIESQYIQTESYQLRKTFWKPD